MVEANIEFWLKGSEDAFDTAQKLFEVKKYNHCLFFLHLSLEKLLKALVVKNTNEVSPPIHDLVRLAEKTGVETTEEIKIQLVEISTFNVAARYDDYKYKFYKKATKEYTDMWIKTGETLITFFKNKVHE